MHSVANPVEELDLAVNMARQALYRFAALSFLDPQAGSWDQLAALAEDPLLRNAAALMRQRQPEELGPGERPIAMLDPSRVLDRLPKSHSALNSEYENTFGLLVSSNCPPYETEYIPSKHTFLRSNSLADISGFYRAFGLTMGDERPERPDHIVLELEFMACLLGLERQAAGDRKDGSRDRQQVCRDAQVQFLQEHLGWWAPAFAKLLAVQAPQRFYAAAGEFLAALIPAERAVLGIPPISQRVVPSTVERPELCEGCELAG